MKNIIMHKKHWLLFSSTALILLGTILITAAGRRGSYSAHEWGTFTSVQGADGVLLDWRPLESSRLPGFVYDWTKPGLNRHLTSPMLFTKGALSTLQRMETPVIYFYADRAQSVDVTVKFPHGLITEWYPQAAQIGPSQLPTPPAIAKLDEYAQKVGAKPGFSFASLFGDKNVKESKIHWANVRLLPPAHDALYVPLPIDPSGSHYFAARGTDANYLQLASLVDTNPAPEQEKFLFYRGVGNFSTPLRVTMSSDEEITLANTGAESMKHLVLLGIKDGWGRFLEIETLPAGAQRTVRFSIADKPVAVSRLSSQVGRAVAASLVKEGLYAREATAMVETWRDSWFAEDGLRVLYVLPRAWTDQTLPLTIDPAPQEVVRVMVGRAEILSRALQSKLSNDLTRAEAGDSAGRADLLAELRKLGRFGEPALRLATKDSKAARVQVAWSILAEASKPASKPL